jgi:hypothetical protein
MPEEVLMFNNYTHFACPQFRLLSNKQVEKRSYRLSHVA